MRLVVVSSLCVVALLTATASSSVASGRASGCRAARANVVVADAQAEVFTARQTIFGDHHEPLRKRGVYRGCVFAKGRSFVLGAVSSRETCSSRGCAVSVDKVTLVGPMVAYERTSTREQTIFEPGGGMWTVVVRDLRSGRVVRTVPTGESNPPNPHNVGAGPTTSIVLKPDGSVAWIVETAAKMFEVHAADRSGSRLLASGSDIDPRSLALAGSTFYWTHAGRAVSASLN